jgi:hypothetical protein
MIKLTLCLLIVASTSALASESPPPELNPKKYVSPSGAYSLAVDPTDIYGRGPADCRLAKNGKILWKSRLPFAFWGVVVADSGRVAGYAYTQGRRGLLEGGDSDGPGEVVVALLSAEGKIVNQHKHARKLSLFQHSPPDPLINGLFLDQSNQRFVVRVADADRNRQIEQWWVFDLKSGNRIGALEPGRAMPAKKAGETLLVLHARAVPGTPLVLIQWWKYASGKCGGVFTLIDPNRAKAKPVWTLSLDGDYSVPGNRKAENAIRKKMWGEGAILDVDKSPGFAILAVKWQQRIVFSMRKAKDGSWRVSETVRAPY